MEQSKTLVFLKEKLALEGLDDSEISIKLKEARDAIERACDACMVTDEDDKQEFWDDHNFSNDHYYWIENVKFVMRKQGSSESEISDAIKKARRALYAAKEACTTDVERAESMRMKDPEDDPCLYEGVVYEKFDADHECGRKDRVVVLQEQLISAGVDKSYISIMLKEAEAAIQRVFSLCAFNEKEKQIFRCDIYGKYSGDLVYITSCRLRKLVHDEVTVEEMRTMAFDAIRDVQDFYCTCMSRYQANDEKDGGPSKRSRMY